MPSAQDKPKRRVLAEGKYLRLLDEAGWEIVERLNCTGIVALAPVTDDGYLVLVEQYRRAPGVRVLELPAGLVGDLAGQANEAMLEAAYRELLEETGYAASELKWLFKGPTSPGGMAEIVDFYLATGLKRVHAGGGDEHEDIKVHLAPVATLEAWLSQTLHPGLMLDPKVYMGAWFARQWLAYRQG